MNFSIGDSNINVLYAFAQLEPVTKDFKIEDEEKIVLGQRMIATLQYTKSTNNIASAEKNERLIRVT